MLTLDASPEILRGATPTPSGVILERASPRDSSLRSRMTRRGCVVKNLAWLARG